MKSRYIIIFILVFVIIADYYESFKASSCSPSHILFTWENGVGLVLNEIGIGYVIILTLIIFGIIAMWRWKK